MRPYYEQDGITIYHGDCREVLAALSQADLLLTDPPYGIFLAEVRNGFMAQRGGQDAAQWDAAPSAELLNLVLGFGKHSIVWGFGYFADVLGKCVAPLVWDKQTGANYFADGELAWTSFTSGTLRIFRHQWCGAFKASERGEQFHPTQKPVALMQWCMERAPARIATVVDPFMGSGSVLVAARNTGRRAVGIEIEERYCEIAARRLDQTVLAL